MKYVRLWFVALLMVGISHGTPQVVTLPDDDEHWEPSVIERIAADPALVDDPSFREELYVPIPDRPFYSLLDSTTGTWRKEVMDQWGIR